MAARAPLGAGDLEPDSDSGTVWSRATSGRLEAIRHFPMGAPSALVARGVATRGYGCFCSTIVPTTSPSTVVVVGVAFMKLPSTQYP